MQEGTVKFFNNSKGFGFIKSSETGEDIFVHVSNLNGLELREGEANSVFQSISMVDEKIKSSACIHCHFSL